MDDVTARRYRDAADWLLRLNSDDIPEEVIASWLQWCEADAANLRAYERVQSDWRDVVSLRRHPRAVPNRHSRAPRWFLAASIVVLVFGSALWAGHLFLGAPKQIVARTQNRSAVLPDGSALVVQAQSAVDLKFTDEERRLDLKDNGEAYFKVHHEASRPFVVRAGAMKITALGTAFDVRRNAERTQVTVDEGTVRVALSDNQTWIVSAGERFDSGAQAIVSKVSPTQAPRWREGRFGYDGAPLALVLQDVNRYRPHSPIHVLKNIADLPYTGTVFISSVEDWLQALTATYPVVVARLDDGTIELRPSLVGSRGRAATPVGARDSSQP